MLRFPVNQPFTAIGVKYRKRTWKAGFRMSGKCLVTEADRDLAIDSSGFELLVGSIWRLLKWGKRTICKSFSLFLKVHLVVVFPSRAIVSIEVSKSTVHDSVAFGAVCKSLYKRIARLLQRVHLDKAYWSENHSNFLEQEGIQAVIPCKSNSVNHGTGSRMDKLVWEQRHTCGGFIEETIIATCEQKLSMFLLKSGSFM